MVMLMAWSMGAKADHTATLDLASIKVTGCTIDAETHVVTYTDNFKAAYWDLSDAMKSFTTATVTIENTATIDIRITLRYTPVGASETSDITATIAAGETTAVLDIPESGTLGTLRVGNWNKGAGTCKIVSAVLSGLRDKYQFGLEALPRSASNTSYDATTKTITFGADGTSAATTYQYRGWTIGNAYLNDYKTYVVEFEPVNYKVQLQIPYDNGSGKTQYASTTVEAGEKRGSVTMPTDATTITGFTVKNATNPNSAVSQTLTLKKAYLTTEEIAYFDMTKCTSTWDDGATSSYDASTYTISWTSNTRRGWYVNADTYNGYKTIVIEFQPAPVAMTGEIRYKATSDASVTSTTFTVPVGSTMLTLPVPETIYNISAIFLIPASACSLTLTDAYATNKEYENSKTITLSTTETTCGDSWASGYLKLEKEALGLAQAGDQLAVTVTAVSSTDGSPCVALQTGSFSNFDPAVSSYSLSGKTASEENPITATFTLTEAMLNTINGNTENVNSGLVVKGSGFTFNQVDLIHNIYKIKGQPATNLWSGEEVITWNDPSNYVTLPASTFALAKKDMKLRMSFKDLKLSAQGRLSSSAWKAVPDADSYESLKTDWGNYYEFTITDAMLAELQAHGVNITGVGYTLISVDIIDPDCEYDITADFDTNDIIAWETTDGTPNLTVTITNNEAYEITVPINIALMTDMFTDFNTYSANVTLAAGETKVKNVEFNDLTAGFYRMSANVAGNKLCTYYIGYNPTAIVSTDGPHLNISPYNLLTNVAAADKEYSINQFKGHAAADNWGTTYMAFFQKYIDAGTPLTIDNPVTVTAAGYGTYYNSTATQLPTGMQAATIDAASGNTLTINWRYDGDDNEKNVIPGGTAVMLKSSAGDHTLTLLPANTDAAPAGNLLHGSDVATTTTGGDIYYKLTYGSAGSENADKLGWYWGADNGAAFSIGAHKAWLALSNGQQAPSFFLLDDEIPTSISESLALAQSNGEEVVYTLHGQRVSHPAKGLYIVNGKKVVMK